MADRGLERLKTELQRLMLEEVQSLKAATFGGVDEEELRTQRYRLQRIREISADLLVLLKLESGDAPAK
jgi:hypothetical protein